MSFAFRGAASDSPFAANELSLRVLGFTVRRTECPQGSVTFHVDDICIFTQAKCEAEVVRCLARSAAVVTWELDNESSSSLTLPARVVHLPARAIC